MSEKNTGNGKGTIKNMLEKYVCFDSEAVLATGRARAHGIFAWDKSKNSYHYWWFEDSGSYNEASCRFIGEDALFMNWYDGLLVQSFQKKGAESVELRMEHPKSGGGFELVLQVIMTRV